MSEVAVGRRDARLWAATGSPLEYWFFRVSWPGGALLVDVIDRRAQGSREVRVAFRDGIQPGLVRLTTQPGQEDTELTLAGSRGVVDRVGWDLEFTIGDGRLAGPPQPLRALGAVDLSLVSWPDIRCRGVVAFDGRPQVVDEMPGMVCHYWGRRLPRQWVWLSAPALADGLALEASVLDSTLWGTPIRPPGLGYAWLREGERQSFTASPLTGLVRCHREGDRVELAVRGHGGWRVRAEADPDSFVDLGEGIRQSLWATCVLERAGRVVEGPAALELRDSTPASSAST